MKKGYKSLSGLIAALTVCMLMVSCAPSYVAVRPGPPVYARPVAPGPGYVWVNENWIYRGGRYQYAPGYWARPRPNRVWVDGNWDSRGGKYRWTPGRWRSRR